MQLDLRACATLVINLRKDEARRASVSALCDRLGLDYRLVEAVECAPGFIGCGLSQIKALARAAPDRPTLILEDDVAASEDFAPLVEVPDDADALYLGVSWFGAIEAPEPVGAHGTLAAEPVCERLFRSHNMLSTHAILYLTERYRLAAAEAMIDALTVGPRPPDMGLSAIQSAFNVYGLRRPAFHQAAALQNGPDGDLQEAATRRPVEIHPVGTVVVVQLPDGPRNAILVRDGGRLAWRFC